MAEGRGEGGGDTMGGQVGRLRANLGSSVITGDTAALMYHLKGVTYSVSSSVTTSVATAGAHSASPAGAPLTNRSGPGVSWDLTFL